MGKAQDQRSYSVSKFSNNNVGWQYILGIKERLDTADQSATVKACRLQAWGFYQTLTSFNLV